jgi:hypothetical protein
MSTAIQSHPKWSCQPRSLLQHHAKRQPRRTILFRHNVPFVQRQYLLRVEGARDGRYFDRAERFQRLQLRLDID